MQLEIKNLKKAADRILKAVKNQEKIVLYADADLDGLASVIILKEAIKNLGGKIEAIYFPDREKEGYGINKTALDFLKDKAPALFIALDCGISNFEEAKLAKKLGFELIIVDHHEVLKKLPQVEIIVDPKQKGDNYPFKNLATAGLAYKISQTLLGEKMSLSLKNSFLEMVALATLADMMPAVEENESFIIEGLKSLEKTFRPGLRVFWEINHSENSISPREMAQKIISALNTSQNQGHLSQAYLLLSSPDLQEAKKLAQELLEKSYQRQIRIKEITLEIEEKILKKLEETIIFEGDSSWPLILLGPVASRICSKYKKPTFLFRKNDKESSGAVRVPQGLNGVEALINCSKFLESYGGHPPAAGFRIKNENLEEFKKCLVKYFKK